MKHICTIAFVVFLSVFGIFRTQACTNFLVTKGASASGHNMISYSADSHLLYGELYHWPAADYAAGTWEEIYEWDSGKHLGHIPQVAHTYNVVGNMNEHQVAIGETTFGGRNELVNTKGLLDYGSLIYIALKRSKTARQAIQVMTELVATHGYYSSGESFSIMDANEVWILEMIGRGEGINGALWVAMRIPDGYISGHANQARITQFPQKKYKWNDPKADVFYAADVVKFATDKGWYKGPAKDFSFSDTFAPVDFGAARFCDARVWAGFLKAGCPVQAYEAYALGHDLSKRMPLWVKPDKKIALHAVMDIMRDHYEGTPMDMTKDFGAGPYALPYRWRPLTWKIDSVEYLNERAIATQQTGFVFVAEARAELPDALGGILWWGVDDASTTVFNPVYSTSTYVGETVREGNGSMMQWSDNAAFWVFNQVSNYAYTRYNAIYPEIRTLQLEFENKFLAQVPEIDTKAQALYASNPAEAVALLSQYSASTIDATTVRWKQLYNYLFMKYMDGNVKTPSTDQRDPKLEQPGYSPDWYKNLIKQNGENLKVPAGGTAH
ncbi:MAG: hypothetical protein RIS47_720 [Bacteroidota bacterium]|jgi:dipeptidase